MEGSAVSAMAASPVDVSRHASGLDFSPPAPPQFIPQWIKLGFRGETPEDRCGTRVNCLLGALYITGADRAPGATFDVFAVSLETQECAKVRAAGVAPSPRDSHTATVIGHDLVIVGGTDGAQKFNEIYFFNTIDKTWKMFPSEGNAMPARECHTSTAVGNKLYTFGGLGDRPAQEDLSSSYLADTWCFDADTQTLVQLRTPAGDGPCARDSHAAAACGNSVIVTGGHGGERVGLLDDVWQLDTATNTWRQLRITSQWSPGGCAGHTAVSLGENAILVYGGLTKMRMEKDVWVLYVGPDPGRNLKDGEAYWDMLQVTDSLPPGRYAHAADYSDGCFFITGGVSQNKHNLNDTWVLALTQDAATKMSAGGAGGSALAALKRSKRDEAAPKKITSYNIFCSETREQLRASHPELSSRDIEKLMGQQWGEMTPDLKRAYEDRARQINAAAAAALAAGVASGQVSKKVKVDKPSSQMVTSVQPPHAPATTFQLFTPNPSLIGAQVEGAIDAVFNAGYLATVKVNGFTYRALLFSPYLALSVPVSVQPPTQGSHRPSQ